MIRNTKRVAILLATYNGEKYIKDQVDSLLSQTYEDFVIFVHDDGSVDETIAILKSYALNNPDRIVLLEHEACGSAKNNFMWMLSKVESEIYLFCDQDDVWLPQKVEKLVPKLDTQKDRPQLVFSDMYVVDESLNILSNSFVTYIGRSINNIALSQILIDNPAAGCCMAINKSLRDLAINTGSMDKIPMHDVWLLAIGAAYGKVWTVNEPLVYYRQTGHNTMGAKTESDTQKVRRNILNLLGADFFARKKAFIQEARDLARELVTFDEALEKELRMPMSTYELLCQFRDIAAKGKLSRIGFYKKNNFTRANHNLWMLLWV